MKPFFFVMLCVISFFVMVFHDGFFCLAYDTNMEIGLTCGKSDNTVDEETFQTNKKTLLDSLASNVVEHHGFYQTIVGTKSNRVYGTILCRGDISAANCSVCALNSTREASNSCTTSRDLTIWFRWCFVRYSNDSFFGEMQGTTFGTSNKTDIDDPSLVFQGIPFMSGVAVATSVNSFMFHTEVLNFNQSEKRYGLAQCTRDISRKDCRRCLDGQLDFARNGYENKKRWATFGYNCLMWYNDYQFYFNNGSTLLLSAAWRPSSCRSLVSGITFAVSAALLIVF